MSKVKRWHIAVLLIIAIFLILAGIGFDNRLQTTNYNVYDNRIPDAFDGFKIAQLSDLHSLWFGEGQNELISAVKAGNPDIIVLTGDIVDARIQDFDAVAALLDGLSKIAPVYAVSGNHENNSSSIQIRMNNLYKAYNIVFLKDIGTTIEKNASKISIYGLDDRSKKLRDLPMADPGTYEILLFHRSDLFDLLAQYGYDLVFSGHMHGGLIRIPFVRGIISPEGEIDYHLKYDGGMYTVDDSVLISNRGLAPSHNIPRIFNRPEVVFAVLRSG